MRRAAVALFIVLLAAGAIYWAWLRDQEPAGPQATDGALRIHFLDVGQGDAILVLAPDGKSMLYDAGPDRDLAARLLREHGVKQLDLAVASQGDADHIAGFEGVARDLKPRVFLNNGLAKSTRTYGRVIEAMRAAGAQGLLATERTIKLGERVEVQVLPAPPEVPDSDQNANSVGILVRFGSFRAFFGGDAEPSTTRGWAERYGKALAGVPVYKALHHGSRHNDNAAFLRLVRPKEVVIGVGSDNRYGHPTGEALALYREVGARVHRTDLHGEVTVSAREDGTLEVRSERQPRDPAEVQVPGGKDLTGDDGRLDLNQPSAAAFQDRDCGDFPSRAEAQAFFEAEGGPTVDPHRLDPDQDGRVCESLR